MRKFRVLAIDDDCDILSLIESILFDEYEIICINNPLIALEMIDDIEPDFFLVDIMMPLLDGREFVRRIRQKKAFTQAPIIFLSVLSDRNIIIDSYKAGGDFFLNKPFSPNRFLDSISASLSRKIIPVRQKRFSINEIQKRVVSESIKKHKEILRTPLPIKKIAEVVAAAPQKTPVPKDIKSELKPKETVTTKKVETPNPVYTKQDTPAPQIEKEKKQEVPARIICSIPRILYADDDPEILDFVTMSLGDKYELFTVRNGLDVVKESEFLDPDIFILDGMMPRFSGYQVCQVLKKSGKFHNTPIIIVSAKASRKDIEYVKKLGVKAFIAKPFDFMQLDNAIVKIVQSQYFEIKSKMHTYEDILNIRKKESEMNEKKEKDRKYIKTRNVLGSFLNKHSDE
jgi:DNA-binding response OmpR family regulator